MLYLAMLSPNPSVVLNRRLNINSCRLGGNLFTQWVHLGTQTARDRDDSNEMKCRLKAHQTNQGSLFTQ